MSITEKFKLLPAPLWILEVEKSTVGTGFTITSKYCIIKPLNKNTTAAS